MDVVDADDLDAKASEYERDTQRAGGSVGVLVADHLANEAFTRMPDKDGAIEAEQGATGADEFQVVQMCFAKTNTRVEADAFWGDSGTQKRGIPRG